MGAQDVVTRLALDENVKNLPDDFRWVCREVRDAYNTNNKHHKADDQTRDFIFLRVVNPNLVQAYANENYGTTRRKNLSDVTRIIQDACNFDPMSSENSCSWTDKMTDADRPWRRKEYLESFNQLFESIKDFVRKVLKE